MTAALPAALFDTTDPTPQTESQLRAAIDRELLMVVLRAGQRSPITSALAASLIAALMSYDTTAGRFRPSPPAVAWLAAMLGVLALNAWYATSAVRSGVPARRQQRLALGYGLLGSLTAMLWGASLWLFTTGHDAVIDNALVAAIAMVLCGGAIGQATHGLQVRLFVYPLTAVATTALLHLGGPVHTVLAGAFPLLAFHVMAITRNFERFSAERLRLAMINEQLSRKADAERQAADHARQEAEALRALAEQAREDAVQASRAKSNFIAATSHDLRQPLHALVQYVADLKTNRTPALQGDKVARIEHAVSVLVGLMDAVLDFSRMSAGDLRPDLRAVDLPTLLASLESQTLPAARARGLQLQVQPCAGCVLSDEALLLRVLGNVVHNAVRYTATGGVLVRARPRRGGLRVLVADSGIGIPLHLQARVFDAYFQVDNPERDRRKGLGLGLAIVRDLGRLLGLRVRLRSRPGRGTVFSIDIPQARVPPRPQDGPDVLASDYVQGALVLLIDDDPLARDGMATTLRSFGCRVLDAGSGAEAAQRLAASEFVPQVIVSDLRLAAGVNGARLAIDLAERQVLALGPGFRPLLLVVTGDTQIARLDSDDDGQELLVLKKPVAPHTLYAALNAALSRAATQAGDDHDPDRR